MRLNVQDSLFDIIVKAKSVDKVLGQLVRSFRLFVTQVSSSTLSGLGPSQIQG